MDNIDYIKNGKIHADVTTNMVMVASKSEAESTLGDYPPGTIAFTAGYTNMWQKASNGSWVALEV